MPLSFLHKTPLPNEIYPLNTSRISQEKLGSPSLALEMLWFAKLPISILKEAFLIKVTKAHVLFLDTPPALFL